MDAVFGDEAVDDVQDGVAVVGVEGVELVDAFGDGGVGGAEGVAGCVVEEEVVTGDVEASARRMSASRLGVILPVS